MALGHSSSNLEVSDLDVEIGAVEIKDSTGTSRGVVTSGSDNLANGNQLVTASMLYGYDGTTYDRIRLDTLGDSLSASSTPLPASSYLLGYDEDNSQWNRLRSTRDNGLEVRIQSVAGGAVIPIDFTFDYAEDSPHASGNMGAFILAVRQDTATQLAGTDGDYSPLITNSAGRLHTIDANTASLAVVGGGVEATALRVTIASDSTGLLSVDDNASSLTIDNAALSVVGGGVEATALRVTIASDSTGLVSVDDNAGSLTIDNAALAVVGGGVEATALRVTLASDSTGLVSVDDNASSLTIDNAALSVVGTGLEATALRVTIASDSTGLVSVDDNAGSLTVDNAALSVVGTGLEATALRVTVATDSTGVLSVDDNAGSLTVDNAALSVTGGGVEATALRVTIASDSTGVLSIDDNGASLTTDTVGNVAHDAADSGNPVKIGTRVERTAVTEMADADRSDALSDNFGNLYTSLGNRLTSASIDKTTTASQDIVAAPGVGNHLRIYGYWISNEGTESVTATVTSVASHRTGTDGNVAVHLPGYIDLATNTAATATLSATSTNGVVIGVWYRTMAD